MVYLCGAELRRPLWRAHAMDPNEPPAIPVGSQNLLRLATANQAVLEDLVAHRGACRAAAKVRLTDAERSILESIPEDQLRTMIAHLPAAPAEPKRDRLARDRNGPHNRCPWLLRAPVREERVSRTLGDDGSSRGGRSDSRLLRVSE